MDSAPQLPLLYSQQSGSHGPPGPHTAQCACPCPAVHGHLCSSQTLVGLQGHTTAGVPRDFSLPALAMCFTPEVRSSCCCMGEQRENYFVSCPGNPRGRGTGNPWGIPSRGNMIQLLWRNYPPVFHRCRVKNHPGLSNPVLPYRRRKMLLPKKIFKPCRLFAFAPFIRRLFAFLTVRRFPMANSGWIAWSPVVHLPGLSPHRGLPASQISTLKDFSGVYLYLALLNIRLFLSSPLPPLYLLTFLFGIGLFLQAFFPSFIFRSI